MRLFAPCVASCLLLAGCGGESELSTSTSQTAVADVEETKHGPELLSPDAYDWLPRRGDDATEDVVWRFDWADEPEASAYEFELSALPSPRVTEKKIVTTEVEKSEYEQRWQEPMEAFPRGCAWRVRARIGERWEDWSNRRTFYVEPSEETKQEVRRLAELLLDKDGNPGPQRTRVAGILSNYGPAARAAVPELIEILKKDHDLATKMDAIQALYHMGPAASDALPQLLVTMRQKTLHEQEAGEPDIEGSILRYRSIEAVAWIGGKKYYPQVVRKVIEILDATDGEASLAAFSILRDINDLGPDGVSAIPYLIRGIQKGDSGSRANAAIALGNIGPAAQDAVPALEELAGIDVRDYRNYRYRSAAEHAAKALTKIRGIKHAVRR